MNALEKKKIETELGRLQVGIMEDELSIMQRQDDIRRIEEQMEIKKKLILEKKELLK